MSYPPQGPVPLAAAELAIEAEVPWDGEDRTGGISRGQATGSTMTAGSYITLRSSPITLTKQSRLIAYGIFCGADISPGTPLIQLRLTGDLSDQVDLDNYQAAPTNGLTVVKASAVKGPGAYTVNLVLYNPSGSSRGVDRYGSAVYLVAVR